MATSALAYVEARATFARALREQRISREQLGIAIDRLDVYMARYALVPVDDARLREASDLADRHTSYALRALDAIHLASALRLAAGKPADITFACWDLRLWHAAHDEGFTMLPDAEPA